jgi:predicted phage gp36 major capsid-like protein
MDTFSPETQVLMHHKRTIEEQCERETNRQRLQREKLSIAKKTVICERDAATHARSKAARSAKELQPLRASDARSQRRIYAQRVHAYNCALSPFKNILNL